MTPDFDDIPLPEGWVEEFHESGHPYYVDTRADPPRSIWIHPYEDEQYLQQHPEDKGKLQAWMGTLEGQPPLYVDDVKVPIAAAEGSNREFYGRAPGGSSPAPGMNSSSPVDGRGPLSDRGIGGGERGLGGLLAGGGLLGALDRRAEMVEERRGFDYDPRFGMGPGGPGMMMERRGFGTHMDRRAMRREEKHERRMQRREEKFERRMEKRFGGRYAPPSYARPVYYPGQFSSGYGQQYGGQSYYAPPPSAATPTHQEEHHGGKILPFLGGVAVGVAGDELFHHFKDKKDDKN